MRSTVSRTIEAMSTDPAVVTSPAMCTWPVVIMVSTATRLRGSCASIASRMESLIWSAILSGWPSVTDSEVKRRRGTRYSLGRWVGDDYGSRADRSSRGPGATLTAGHNTRWDHPVRVTQDGAAPGSRGTTVAQMPAATASLLPRGTSVAEPSAARTTAALSARPNTWPADT